jgi:hypothetical protein
MKETEDKQRVFKEVDLCSQCLIVFCAALFGRMAWEDRPPWIKAFLSNVIG